MPHTIPTLDHIVLDVRDRIDDAARVYRSLGFQLTDRGYHTLGSVNHLAVFSGDYLELLGFNPKAEKLRPDILAFPVGLNGLVFGLNNPEALFKDLQARGVPVDPPQAFSRPVTLPQGTEDAKFNVVRLRSGTTPFGRVYFCQHLTPDLVWRPEWRQHPNGATAVSRITIAACDLEVPTEFFNRMFGADAVCAAQDGVRTVSAGTVHIDLVTPEKLKQIFGDAVPDPAGRQDYMASLSIRTSSLKQTGAALQAGGIRPASSESKRILVPAAEAMNVTLEFVE